MDLSSFTNKVSKFGLALLQVDIACFIWFSQQNFQVMGFILEVLLNLGGECLCFLQTCCGMHSSEFTVLSINASEVDLLIVFPNQVLIFGFDLLYLLG